MIHPASNINRSKETDFRPVKWKLQSKIFCLCYPAVFNREICFPVLLLSVFLSPSVSHTDIFWVEMEIHRDTLCFRWCFKHTLETKKQTKQDHERAKTALFFNYVIAILHLLWPCSLFYLCKHIKDSLLKACLKTKHNRSQQTFVHC